MQATRQDILDYIRRHGEATVRELGDVLGLTATGIRQHLTVLERDGLIAVRETRGRIGRPALVYSLTSSGHALYPHRNDDLANLLLEEIRTIAGGEALQSILMRIAARSADAYMEDLNAETGEARIAAAVEVINERGCVADYEPLEGDQFLINQYTCPFPRVADSNSGVCALEVEFVRRLSGGDARLVRSLLRGDPCCSYRIRPSPAASMA